MPTAFLKTRSLILVVALAVFCVAAHAQSSNLGTNPRGACADGRINYVFTTMTMVPSGTGSTGECNPGRYGSGPASWTSQQALNIFVVHSRDCMDPWIGELYFDIYGRVANTTQCDASHYGGGKWTSFGDLSNKIRDYQIASVLSPNQLYVGQSGDMINNLGRIIYPNATATVVLKVISNDGGSLLTTAQRTALVNRMSGLTPVQRASIISQAGTGLTASQQKLISDAGGNLSAAEKQELISNQASLIGENSSGVISNPRGQLVSPSVGQVISTSGSNYALASVGGKQVVPVTSITRR